MHPPTLSRRKILALATLAAPGFPVLAQPTSAHAGGDWPSRPIELLVGFASDTLEGAHAAWLAQSLGALLAQPVKVVHKPGSNHDKGGDHGISALAALTKATADGYTLAYTGTNALTHIPHVRPVPFDPLKDFAPVAHVANQPLALIGTRVLKAHDFEELMALTQEPGRAHWISGRDDWGHLVQRHITRATGAHLPHSPVGTQGLGNQLVLVVPISAIQLMQVLDGTTRPLAIIHSERMPFWPDVPTLAELGHAVASEAEAFGLLAPANTPAPVLHTLQAAVVQALQSPELIGRFKQAASPLVDAAHSGGDRFAQTIARQYRTHAVLAKNRKIEENRKTQP